MNKIKNEMNRINDWDKVNSQNYFDDDDEYKNELQNFRF